MMSTIPKMICPWINWTIPTMTRMAAMIQSTVGFTGHVYPGPAIAHRRRPGGRRPAAAPER